MCQPLGWHYFVKMTGYLPFTFFGRKTQKITAYLAEKCNSKWIFRFNYATLNKRFRERGAYGTKNFK